MLQFDQCLNIREAGMNIRQITKAARHRKLSPQELLNIEVQLRRIESWLNTRPTSTELFRLKWGELRKRLVFWRKS